MVKDFETFISENYFPQENGFNDMLKSGTVNQFDSKKYPYLVYSSSWDRESEPVLHFQATLLGNRWGDSDNIKECVKMLTSFGADVTDYHMDDDDYDTDGVADYKVWKIYFDVDTRKDCDRLFEYIYCEFADVEGFESNPEQDKSGKDIPVVWKFHK